MTQNSWQSPLGYQKSTISADTPDDISDMTKMKICQPTNFIKMFKIVCHYTQMFDNKITQEHISDLYPVLNKECCKKSCSSTLLTSFCQFLKWDGHTYTTYAGPATTTENMERVIITFKKSFPWLDLSGGIFDRPSNY
ncbi:Hypothetical protein CINCED_3A011966 [Cinara cedri]|nr:Hypothetical protein CINCED_3A011966 [Cinara cedri]